MSLEGRLEDMGLADIFQIISLSKRSGVLTLIRKEGTGRLVFNQGRVIFASSDTRSRLGYTLVKKGIIRNDDLEYALRIQKGRGSKKPIGTILLEMGSIDQETFERELKGHVVSVISDLLGWDSGSFYFELAVPSKEEDEIAASTGFNTESLILEAFKMKDEEEHEKQQAEAKGAVAPSGGEAAGSAGEPSGAVRGPSLVDRKDLQLLMTMISELTRQSSNSELTLMILRFASELMGRAMVFLVRRDAIVGLGQFGFSQSEGDDQERVRSVRIPLDEPSVLKDVVESKRPYKGPFEDNKWHRYLIEQMGNNWPGEAFVAPVVCEGQCIAILYADNIPSKEGIGETEGLEAFIKVAEISFSKALLERKLREGKVSSPTA
jgi:hypothetical protein